MRVDDGEPPGGNDNAPTVRTAEASGQAARDEQDSTRDAAKERFRRAKIAFGAAAAAALANDPHCERQAGDALAELNAARDELRRAGGEG